MRQMIRRSRSSVKGVRIVNFLNNARNRPGCLSRKSKTRTTAEIIIIIIIIIFKKTC
jgi:hypothetical protein